MAIANEASKIAVIGAGIAGITAAFLLDKKYTVTLFESNESIGGHTNTRIIEGPVDEGVAIDTGFIVCNAQNYPNFYTFLNRLGVDLQNSDMSFGFYCEETGLNYVGPKLSEFVRVPGNFLRPQFCRMLLDRYRFNKQVLADLRDNKVGQITMGEYLSKLKVSKYFIINYLQPLVASIWSSPDVEFSDFPATTFAIFFKNHGMLELNRIPQWQTISGGSHKYIEAFKKVFKGRIKTQSRISRIERANDSIAIHFDDRSVEHFRYVVIATHADEALALLADPDPEERRLLATWRYSRNLTTLHCDPAVLSTKRKHWASWNYRLRNRGPIKSNISITYYMNKLQSLRTKRDYFVTLNTDQKIDPSLTIYQTEYKHPIYTVDSVMTQQELKDRNGQRNTFYCGAHLGYGFHEDGVSSALSVAHKLGTSL